MDDTARTAPANGPPDRMVGERYRLVERIARGGMAEVYAADDITAGRRAAVKILPPTEDAETVARFKREAEAATRLTHPHIVTTHEFGDYDGTHYIAMEYVPGPTLKQTIQEQGPLPEKRALEIAAQLADALDFAHRRGVTHRDVKPQNVLLDAAGNAKLADFGIARVAGSINLTQTRSVLGTAHYLSPEQARGAPLDRRTDLYSLGVVLFEMLTGRVPFEGDSPLAVALKHADEAPPRVRDINPQVSPEAEAVVAKVLVKDPGKRYQSAAEMRDAIEAAAASSNFVLTAETQRMTPPAPAIATPAEWRRTPRRLSVWLVAASVAAVLIALVIGVTRASGVSMPDVRGMTEDEARAAVEASGLELDVAGTLVSAEVPRGRVISQQPGAGERVDRDGTVEVAISSGQGTVRVPEVLGRTEADATIALRDAGFVTATLQRVQSDRPTGTVIDQTPPGGREVPPDTNVELVSSAGRAAASQPPAPVVQQPAARNQGRGRKRD